MNIFRRRQSSRYERLTPCWCCEWPISERHHLLEVARYGENNHTVQLCANCHELYHIIYAAYKWEHDMRKDPFKNRAAQTEHMIRAWLQGQGKSYIVGKLYGLAQQAYDLKGSAR